MVMERETWLMEEDRLEGRRTFMLTVLDEAGQPIDVIEGVTSIIKYLSKYEDEGDFSKSGVPDRG
jgi:hypothetical protein